MASPSVTLPQGTYRGVTETGTFPGAIECFKAVPYALPPVGDRRFRPPAPLPPSTAVFDATAFGPRAPARQFLVIGPALPESEDCLTANIFRTPRTKTNTGELWPVALYIHGGAFNRGNATMHDTGSMVGWSAAPMVGVSFGYRIGSLGFLPSQASADEGVLNLGLRDQIAMLEWVQQNIHHFGGDKTKVTLIGLSAGAHSIGYHLLNYTEGVPPLFRAVVLESGAPTSRALRFPHSAIHEQQFAEYLTAVGCPSGLSSAEIFAFLRKQPLATLTAAQDTVFYRYNPSLRWAFQPVMDGQIIRRRPLESWRAGLWYKVPIMTGFTTNEGSLYVDKQMATTAQFRAFWQTLLPQLTDDDLTTIERLYPDPLTVADSPYREDRLGVGAMYRRIEAAYAHYAYIAPARQTAQCAGNDVPVYLYRWALEADTINGARHGDNMLYEVRSAAKCGLSPAQETLSATVHAYVTSFICTGDPNALTGVARPTWAAYQPDKPKVLAFGLDNKELVGGAVGPAATLIDDVWAQEQCAFWWSKVAVSQQ